jgi:hypothetical protein
MSKFILLFLLVLLSACGSEPSRPQPVAAATDFSGHWEMDYGRSDDVNNKLQLMHREWRRLMEKRANNDRRGSQGPSLGVDMSRDFNRTVALARFADLITETQVLEIVQTNIDIEVRRENNFALTCVFSEKEPVTVVDELGLEICGWNAHQLVFHIRMPDGLDIRHRLTMSTARDRLHVATTVDSKSSRPFTLNRFYFRFNPLPENFSCEYTLSKGNVCQSGGTP